MNISILFKIIKDEGVLGIVDQLKQKVLTKTFGYILILDEIDYEQKYEYKLLSMTMEILNNMMNENRNEIEIDKFNILINRIENNKFQKAFVIKNNEEQICGYFHMSYKDARDGCINYNIKVNSDTVYLFDDYTFEKFRGKGVHKFSIIARLKIAKLQGYKKAIVNIISNNIHSEKSYINIGFKKNIKYIYYHILKFNKTFEKVIINEY